MPLNLKGCTELELLSYKVLLLKLINDSKDVLTEVEKKLIKVKKGKKNAQTKN